MKRSFGEIIFPLSAGLALLMLFVCVVLLVLTVPYKVHLTAMYRQDEPAVWYWLDKEGDETEFETRLEGRIGEGEGVRLGAERVPLGTLEILKNRGAFAYLSPEAELVVERATQEGLFWEHFRLSEDLNYELILKQNSGLILYDFAQSEVPLADLNLIVRLPQGDYQPLSPCFQADARHSSLVEIPCGNDLKSSEPLNLP